MGANLGSGRLPSNFVEHHAVHDSGSSHSGASRERHDRPSLDIGCHVARVVLTLGRGRALDPNIREIPVGAWHLGDPTLPHLPWHRMQTYEKGIAPASVYTRAQR